MELVLDYVIDGFVFDKSLREMVLYIPLTKENIKKFCIPFDFMRKNGKPTCGLSIWKFTHLHLVNIETDEFANFKVNDITIGKQPPIDDMVFFIVKFE